MGASSGASGARHRDLARIAGSLLAAIHATTAAAQEVPFRRVHEMMPSASLFRRPFAGDLDADGDPDLMSGSFAFYRFLNADHGRFEATLLYVGTSRYQAMDLVDLHDLDQDGSDDLVAVTDGPTAAILLGVWLNAGAGASFTLSTSLANSGALRGVAAGDMDGDGDDDLYGFAGPVSLSGVGDRLYLNDGLGAFPQNLLQDTARTSAVALADLDRDGDLDAVKHTQGLLLVQLNSGDGTFSTPPTQPPTPPVLRPENLKAADLDTDGLVDFFAGNPPRLFANRGQGAFEDLGEVLPLVISPSYQWSQELLLGDVDRDEFVDAVGVFAGLGAAVFRNSGNGSFEWAPRAFRPRSTDSPELPDEIAALPDVDGDGDLDVAAVRQLWLNDGTGSFADVTRDAWELAAEESSAFVINSYATFTAGNVDRDPFPDVIAFQQLNPRTRLYDAVLYRNRGTGEFSKEKLGFSSQSPYGNGLDNGALYDMDGDGDLDVFAGTGFVGAGLLLNDGGGSFVDASQRLPVLPPPPAFGSFSTPSDLDGDGDLDLLMFVRPSNFVTTPTTVTLWTNDGEATFTQTAASLPSLPGYVRGAAIGDVDRDSDPDLWINSYYQSDALWLNDGTGSFVDASANIHTQYSYGATHFGLFTDLDGDGSLDYLGFRTDCHVYCEMTGNVFLNDGSSVFTEDIGYWPGSRFLSSTVDARDFDEDGDGDVIAATCGYWVNEGGMLVNHSQELPFCLSAPFARLADADFDLDGDLDVWYENRPVMNTTRHVSWRSYPRAGKPLTMEVFGPANTPFQLFSSAGFTEPQPTDYGYLRLATRGARLVASGTLDSLGRAAVTLGIPSDLALPGNTVYWQALVGSPPRLTNLEFTTFRDL